LTDRFRQFIIRSAKWWFLPLANPNPAQQCAGFFVCGNRCRSPSATAVCAWIPRGWLTFTRRGNVPGFLFMPQRPKRPCTHPGCGVLTDTGRCVEHQRKPWSRSVEVKRVRGRALQTRRQRWFSEYPLCVRCLAVGRAAVAVELDHVIPLAAGGADDDSNFQGLCADCHQQKGNEDRRKYGAGNRPASIA
jgi:5-methylcytosine-specific restriction protein A